MSYARSIRTFFLTSLTGAACIAGTVPAHAGEQPWQNEISAQPLTDAELSEMRGKFVRPENVSFFGITMLTSWQDAQGVTTNARLVFNVDFLNLDSNGNATPVLMIGWAREGDPAMDVTDSHSGYTPYLGPAQVLPVGGIGTHQGAAQANVIAGAGNSARNGLQIALVPASSLSAFSVAGLQSANGTTSLGFTDGDQLSFLAENNRIGIVMTGGSGLDSSIQSLGGDIGQMLQQSLLNSDGNSILNNTSIVLAADNFGQPAGVSVENALSAMKGHGF